MVDNILTIDVEEWFQVSSFNPYINQDEWSSYESRIYPQVEKILEILDAFDTKATFFVLGYLARTFPELIRMLANRGHELASHSDTHELIFTLSKENFSRDLKRSIEDIQQASSQKVIGYRAPSFSVTDDTKWFFNVLEENGIRYDSSIMPGNLRFKNSNENQYPYRLEFHDIVEYPVSTVKLKGRYIPYSGGFFLRTIPYSFIKRRIERVNSEGKPVMIYIHTWELDTQQPLLPVSLKAKFIHYYNLQCVEKKLRSLLSDFCFVPIGKTLPYIEDNSLKNSSQSEENVFS